MCSILVQLSIMMEIMKNDNNKCWTGFHGNKHAYFRMISSASLYFYSPFFLSIFCSGKAAWLHPVQRPGEVCFRTFNENDPAPDGAAAAVKRHMERPPAVLRERNLLRELGAVGECAAEFHGAARIDGHGAEGIPARLVHRILVISRQN